VSSGRTAVDVQGLAGDECGPFEVEDPVDDVADFADPAKGPRHALIGGRVVYGSLDHPGGDRVDADAA
jgi:hypothetical protein